MSVPLAVYKLFFNRLDYGTIEDRIRDRSAWKWVRSSGFWDVLYLKLIAVTQISIGQRLGVAMLQLSSRTICTYSETVFYWGHCSLFPIGWKWREEIIEQVTGALDCMPLNHSDFTSNVLFIFQLHTFISVDGAIPKWRNVLSTPWCTSGHGSRKVSLNKHDHQPRTVRSVLYCFRHRHPWNQPARFGTFSPQRAVAVPNHRTQRLPGPSPWHRLVWCQQFLGRQAKVFMQTSYECRGQEYGGRECFAQDSFNYYTVCGNGCQTAGIALVLPICREDVLCPVPTFAFCRHSFKSRFVKFWRGS